MSGTSHCIIRSAGTDKIDAVYSFVRLTDYQDAISFFNDGNNWNIIGFYATSGRLREDDSSSSQSSSSQSSMPSNSSSNSSSSPSSLSSRGYSSSSDSSSRGYSSSSQSSQSSSSLSSLSSSSESSLSSSSISISDESSSSSSTNDPILFTAMDGDAVDKSSKANPVTVGASVTWLSDTPLDGCSKSAYLAGNSDTTIYYDANSIFNFGTDSFTAECWVKLSGATGNYASIFGIFESTASGNWHVDVQSSHIDFTWRSGSWHNNESSFIITDSAWHHIAVTRRNTT